MENQELISIVIEELNLEENKAVRENLGYAYNVLNRVKNGFKIYKDHNEPISGEIEELANEMQENSKYYEILESCEDIFNIAKNVAKINKIYITEKNIEFNDVKIKEEKYDKDKLKELIFIFKTLRQVDSDEIYSQKKENVIEKAKDIAKKIINNVQPFYEGLPMKGVLVGSNLYTTELIDDNNSIWTIRKSEESQERVLKELNKQLNVIYGGDYNKCYIDENNEKLADHISYKTINGKKNGKNSENICNYFPKFQLAIATGKKGLYAPLTEWMVKKKIEKKINKTKELEEFLTEHLTDLIIRVLNEADLWDENKNGIKCDLDSDGLGYKFLENEFTSSLINCVSIVDYVPDLFYKIRISNVKNINEVSIQNFKDVEKKLLFSDRYILLGQDKGTIQNKNVINLVLTTNSQAYSNIPTFAYTIVESLSKTGMDWSEVPVGKDLKDKMIKLNFAANNNWSIPLIAGSRSGKGVTTLTFVADAMACGYPVIYLDCKPDMAANFYRMVNTENGSTIANKDAKLNIFAIDGNGQSETNQMHRNIELDGELLSISDYVRKQLIKINPDIVNEISTKYGISKFGDTVAYVRGLEILNDFIYYRAWLGRKHSSIQKEEEGVVKSKYEENLPDYNEKYGLDKYEHLVFVLDEIQQFSANFTDLFENETELFIIDPESGKEKKEKCRGIIGEMQKTMQSSAKEWATKIKEWANSVPTAYSGDFLTQSAGQAFVNIFSIAQRTPLQNQETHFYGEAIGKLMETLVVSANNIFWGNENIEGKGSGHSKAPSSQKTNLNKTYGIDPKDAVGTGKFLVVKNGNEPIPVSTYFMLAKLTQDETDDKGKLHKDLVSMFDRIDAAKDIVKKEILNEDEESVKELRVGFRGYINALLERQNKNFAELFTEGYKIFDSFCQDFYGKRLFEKLYDVTNFTPQNAGLITKYRKMSGLLQEQEEMEKEQQEKENQVDLLQGMNNDNNDNDDNDEEDDTKNNQNDFTIQMKEFMPAIQSEYSKLYDKNNELEDIIVLNIDGDGNAQNMEIQEGYEDLLEKLRKMGYIGTYNKQLEGNATKADINAGKSILNIVFKYLETQDEDEDDGNGKEEHVEEKKEKNLKNCRELYNKKMEEIGKTATDENFDTFIKMCEYYEVDIEEFLSSEYPITKDGFGRFMKKKAENKISETIKENRKFEKERVAANDAYEKLADEEKDEDEDDGEEEQENNEVDYDESKVNTKFSVVAPNPSNVMLQTTFGTILGKEDTNNLEKTVYTDDKTRLNFSQQDVTVKEVQKYKKKNLWQSEKSAILENIFKKVKGKYNNKSYKNAQTVILLDDKIRVDKIAFDISEGLCGYNFSQIFDFKYLLDFKDLKNLGMTRGFLRQWCINNNTDVDELARFAEMLFKKFKKLNVINIRDEENDNGIQISRQQFEYNGRIKVDNKVIQSLKKTSFSQSLFEEKLLENADRAMNKIYSSGTKSSILTANEKNKAMAELNIKPKQRNKYGTFFDNYNNETQKQFRTRPILPVRIVSNILNFFKFGFKGIGM